MLLLIALIWIAIGLGVSYAFGRFAHDVDDLEIVRNGDSLALRFWRYLAMRSSSRSSLNAGSVGNLAEATYSPLDR
jgi:hypothetical protein